MTIDQLTKEPRGAAYLKLRTKMDARTILGMQHYANGVRIIVKERSASTGKKNVSIRCPLCPVKTPATEKAPGRSKQLHSPASAPVTQACKELSPTLRVSGHCSQATDSVCTPPRQTEEERCTQRMLSTGSTKGGQQKTQQDKCQLFLSGVKKTITSDMLEDYFSQFGQVLHLHMTIDQLTKKPGGSGYLVLRTTMDDTSKLLQRPTPTGASYSRGGGYKASQSSVMLSEDSDTGALSSVANADPTS
ncbi:RNA recognition motif-containing protein [Sparganum proliferum]